MADLQRAVQALLDELVESGEEVGLQAAVYVEGQLAADCVAGWRSQDRETPVSEHGRMATPFDNPPTGEPPEIDPLVLRCVPFGEGFAEIFNRPEIRSAQVPSCNISATARALARHYAALVGEVDGCRLVSEAHLERVLSHHRIDLPDVLYQRVSAVPQETPRTGAYQLNTGRRDQIMYYGPNPRAFGHHGYGGGFGSADPEAKVALGYTKTLLHFKPSSKSKTRFVDTVYENL